MNFGAALEALKEGHQVSRKGWNGKGMWLCLVNSEAYSLPDDHFLGTLKRAPFVAMRTVDNSIVPWLPSQTDLLAEDWSIDLNHMKTT